MSISEINKENNKNVLYKLIKEYDKEKLSLCNGDIDDNLISIIIEGLKHNSIITSLNLSDNNEITDIGIIEIANYLKNNTTLTKLNMKNIEISEEGTIAINEALKTNITLRILKIDDIKYFKEESHLFEN